jgi:dTDP-4-amino-4,6-dideoxygalactose transaminase
MFRKMKTISFVDLKAQYNSIRAEINEAIQNCIQTTSFIGGQEVANFEKAYSQWLGVDYTIACANGTDSIEILLEAMNIGKGDEVIVPAMSWISTSEAVSRVGATPIFVDIHPLYYTIDTERIEEKITKNTKAIIPVHLYGQPCGMTKIMSIAKAYNLKVLEDCAQAHGAEWHGKKVGTIGDAGSFSFFPGKNLGAYGDAGGMVTNNPEIAERARMIANHGQKGKHNHLIEGRNSRMDTIQAAVLNVKLKYIDEWTEQRVKVAQLYKELITSNRIILPTKNPYGKHVFHLFVIQLESRDFTIQKLKENGIETAIHYPKALPFLKAYKHLAHKTEDFPVASVFQDKILSLPIYPELIWSKTNVSSITNFLN